MRLSIPAWIQTGGPMLEWPSETWRQLGPPICAIVDQALRDESLSDVRILHRVDQQSHRIIVRANTDERAKLFASWISAVSIHVAQSGREA